MTDISIWLKDLLPRTPGANRKVVKREFRLTMREFFAQSYTWREVVRGVPMVEDQALYTPVPADPVNTEVVAVLGVLRNGSPLYPLAYAPLGEPRTGTPIYWYTDPTVMPAVYVHPTPGEIPPGGTVPVLDFGIVVMPKIDAEVVPDWVYQRYYDALFDGALGRLYAHPAKAYSNLVAAQYHLQRFRTAIQQASGAAKQGHVVAQNWRYPPFGK